MRVPGHPRSNRSETFAALPAAVAQGCPAALARISIQESVLPLAAHFRRLILSLHKLNTIDVPWGHVQTGFWPKTTPKGSAEVNSGSRSVKDQAVDETCSKKSFSSSILQCSILLLCPLWLNREAAHMNVFLNFMDLPKEASIMRGGGGLMGTSSVESGFSGSADACRRRAFSQEW